MLALKELLPLPRVDQAARLEDFNAILERSDAEGRVRWALENLAQGHVVNEIRVDDETIRWARVALERMLEVK